MKVTPLTPAQSMMIKNNSAAQRRKLVLDTAKSDNKAISKGWNLGAKGYNYGIYTQVHRGPSKQKKEAVHVGGE